MRTIDFITTNPEILGGTPVFKGKRVPVRTLFDHLERDYILRHRAMLGVSIPLAGETPKALNVQSERLLCAYADDH